MRRLRYGQSYELEEVYGEREVWPSPGNRTQTSSRRKRMVGLIFTAITEHVHILYSYSGERELQYSLYTLFLEIIYFNLIY